MVRILDVAADGATVHWIFAVFFALIHTLVVSSLGAVFVWYLFVSRLRKRHSETWEALGRPSRFLDARSNNFAVSRFLWQRRHSNLPDDQVIRLGTFLRGFLITTVALAVLNVLWFGLMTWWGTRAIRQILG
jgi:hypothetical protein